MSLIQEHRSLIPYTTNELRAEAATVWRPLHFWHRITTSVPPSLGKECHCSQGRGIMSGVPPWSKSVGELASIAPTSGLPAPAPVNSCIVRPPGFPGLELAVPHDAAAGIEMMVEHALDTTVAGIEHGLPDLPTPDSLNVETVFGPSYSRLVKTGLHDDWCRAVARWGGAVFFISNHHAEAREQLRWNTDRARAAERRKAKDAVDTRLASRLAGQWGGTEGAQLLRNQVHERGTKPPKSDRGSVNACLAVATLEGRLNYLLLTGGQSSRSAIGLAALLDARGWSELAALAGCSGLRLPASAAGGGDGRAKLWLDQLAHHAVYGVVKAWGPKPVGFKVIAPPLD